MYKIKLYYTLHLLALNKQNTFEEINFFPLPFFALDYCGFSEIKKLYFSTVKEFTTFGHEQHQEMKKCVPKSVEKTPFLMAITLQRHLE